jgi:vacuolar-type H+-ATPase subunit C/Vma6
MSEYLVVRCHGLVTHLIPSKVVDALALSRSMKDFADMLNPTDYGPRIRELRKLEAKALERIFDDEMIAKYKYVMSSASDADQDFLKAYNRKLEVQALSRILRARMSKPPLDIKASLPSLEGLTDLRINRAAEADDVEKTVELLKGTPYSSIAKSLDWYREYDSVLPLEYHLKKVYYNTVLEALQRLSGEDRDRIGRILGTEIDMTNCFTAVAPVLYGYSTDLSKQLIIPHFFRLSLSNVEQAIEAKSPRSILVHLKKYEEIVKSLLEEKDEGLAETQGLRLVQSEAKKQMIEASIDFAYAICYLILHEIERRNLTLIAYLIQQNVDPRSYLVY